MHASLVRPVVWLLAGSVCTTLLPPSLRPCCAQGVLGQLKEEVEYGEKQKKKSTDDESFFGSDDDHHYHDHHDDDHHLFDIFEPAAGEWLWLAATSPFWYPRLLAGDDGEADRDFLTYPYQADFPGYWMHQHDRRQAGIGTYHPWLLRLRGEYGEDFDSIRRVSMGVLYDTDLRVGLDASLDYYREWLPGGLRDDLWLGDVNVVYRFAQSERFALRSGLGANYLTGTGSTDFGFNFTYGGDWLPARPWILSANIDVGTLGKVGFFRGRATVGINVRKVEFFTGYDYLDVGTVQIGTVIGGIRLWY